MEKNEHTARRSRGRGRALERPATTSNYQGLEEGWTEHDIPGLRRAADQSGLRIEVASAAELGITAFPVLLDLAIVEGSTVHYPNRFCWDMPIVYKTTKTGAIGQTTRRDAKDVQFSQLVAQLHERKQNVDRKEWQKQIHTLRESIPDEINLHLPPGDYLDMADAQGVHRDVALDMRAFLMGEIPANRSDPRLEFERWLSGLWFDAPQFYMNYDAAKRLYEIQKDFSDAPNFVSGFGYTLLEPLFRSSQILRFRMRRYRPYHLSDQVGNINRLLYRSSDESTLKEHAAYLRGRYSYGGGVALEFASANGGDIFHVHEAHVLELGELVLPEASNLYSPRAKAQMASLQHLPVNHTLNLIG